MSRLAVLVNGSDEGRKLDNNFVNTQTGFPTGDSEVVLLGRIDDEDFAKDKTNKNRFSWFGSKLQGFAVAVREKGINDDNAWASYDVNSFGICKAIPEWKSAESLKEEYAMKIDERPHYFVHMEYSKTEKEANDGTKYFPKVFTRINKD